MIIKLTKIVLFILAFYSSVGICGQSRFHHSIGAGFNSGGDELQEGLSTNQGAFVDYGVSYDAGSFNHIRLSYALKKAGRNTEPTIVDFTIDPVYISSQSLYILKSNNIKIIFYHEVDKMNFGIGLSYRHNASLNCEASNYCNSKTKYRNGVEFHIEMAKSFYDLFNIAAFTVGLGYKRSELISYEGISYDSSGLEMFFRFSTI